MTGNAVREVLVDDFGAHILTGTLGTIGEREIGPGHVILTEQRYQWLLARVRADDTLEAEAKMECDMEQMLNERDDAGKLTRSFIPDDITPKTLATLLRSLAGMPHAWGPETFLMAADAIDKALAASRGDDPGKIEGVMAERDEYRRLLIEAGRNAGAFLADSVSLEFLRNVPKEVAGVILALKARSTSKVAGAEMETGWQPLETAPRDEIDILCTDCRVRDGFPQVVFWDGARWSVNDADISYSEGAFTHWHPLPAPPNAETNNSEIPVQPQQTEGRRS